MKKVFIGLLVISSFPTFASASMTCIAHGLNSDPQSVEGSLNSMSRYGKKTVSISDQFINGYAIAIEMNGEGNENNVFPLTKIEKDGKYSIYSINDSFGFLCTKN